MSTSWVETVAAPAHLPPAADRLAHTRSARRRVSRPAAGTARLIAATSSGTSCSSSRSSISSCPTLASALLLTIAIARLEQARAAAQRGRAIAARCSRGRAAAMAARRPSAASQPAVRPVASRSHRTCSVTSTSRSPTTSGSTTMVTGDIQFLRFSGAEMLIEIARFWASIATYNRRARPLRDPRRHGPGRVPRGRTRTRDRAGARQQHLHQSSWPCGCCCARSRRSRSCRRTTGSELTDELGASATRSSTVGATISRKMRVVFHADGVLSPVRGLRTTCGSSTGRATGHKYGDIQRLDRVLEAEGDSTNRYKVSKQAAVLHAAVPAVAARAARAAWPASVTR